MFDEDGRIKVMDFGLARALQSTRLTIEGSTLGTASYMSPESLSGDAIAKALAEARFLVSQLAYLAPPAEPSDMLKARLMRTVRAEESAARPTTAKTRALTRLWAASQRGWRRDRRKGWRAWWHAARRELSPGPRHPRPAPGASASAAFWGS
jgi:hypothetical protein